MELALYKRRRLFSCKRRPGECRCREVCRAGGRRLRDFLFVVSIFFVKDQARSSVENATVGGHFRKMKKVFSIVSFVQKGDLTVETQNVSQAKIMSQLRLSSIHL